MSPLTMSTNTPNVWRVYTTTHSRFSFTWKQSITVVNRFARFSGEGFVAAAQLSLKICELRPDLTYKNYLFNTSLVWVKALYTVATLIHNQIGEEAKNVDWKWKLAKGVRVVVQYINKRRKKQFREIIEIIEVVI